jgi:F0F1-type ATP synthase membrane subunit b/b'
MEAVLSIISALKIDSTLWVQLGLFGVTYILLYYIAFKPYFKAFEGRQGLTEGNQVKAEQIFAQTRELEALYQRKLRGLNADLKDIYDKARLAALKEQERVQAEARESARLLLDKARQQIQEQVGRAREEIVKETPQVSRAITERLLPKEVRQ